MLQDCTLKIVIKIRQNTLNSGEILNKRIKKINFWQFHINHFCLKSWYGEAKKKELKKQNYYN